MSEASLSQEHHTFPPDPAFAAQANGTADLFAAADDDFEAFWARLAPHVTGAYANFLTTATDEDVAAIYPPRTYERLAAVKRRYDPSNLFATNHNIQPTRAAG